MLNIVRQVKTEKCLVAKLSSHQIAGAVKMVGRQIV